MSSEKKITKKEIINLKDSDSIEYLVGFLSKLIFSNEIFIKNNDLYLFINKIFKLELKMYVISSRTLMFSRLSKHIVRDLTEVEIIIIRKNIVNILYEIIDEADKIQNSSVFKTIEKKDKNKRKKKNTTTESISKWIKGIQGE